MEVELLEKKGVWIDITDGHYTEKKNGKINRNE